MLAIAALASLLPTPVQADPTGDERIVAYFIEWGIYARDYHPLDIPADKITHVNYAFANIGDDLLISLGDPYAAVEKIYPGDVWNQPLKGTYNQLNNVLKGQHPHLRTLISVGGWTWSGKFSPLAATPATRSAFAASCVDFIRQYGFDGVDIDWEYPVCCGLPGNAYDPADGANFTLLLEELRLQLDAAAAQDGAEYLLTVAVGAGYDKMANLEMAAMAAHLDWINVMGYDFRGAWDLAATGHHAPLYAHPGDPSANPQIAAKYNVDWSMQAWMAAVPAEKLVLGVPFYGRAWEGVPATNGGLFQPATGVPPGTWDDWSSGDTGVNDYWEIEDLEASPQYVKSWDPISKAPFLYGASPNGGHFISYDDPQSMGLKVDYVLQNDLGGVMFWELTSDRDEVLLDVIHAGLTAPQAGVTPFGCGLNPSGSLSLLTGSPVIGTTFTVGVSNPLGTQPAGSLAVLALSLEPALGYPCGIPLPGFGMAGPAAAGELLLDLSPGLLYPAFGPVAWDGPGSPAAFDLALPPSPGLVGADLYLQGVIVDAAADPGSAVDLALTEGLAVEIGP